MLFLAGEWVPAFIGYGLVWLVALLGVTGLGWWVLRTSARNRALLDDDQPEDGQPTSH
jgi:hypothetical protein